MMTTSFLVSPSTPTGNNRRIELAGLDLMLIARIDNVFVYPAEINLDRLKEALGQTLSFWPFVAGRAVLENDQHYIVEMCDKPIPITFVVNNDLQEWPLNSNVIVELNEKLFPTFIDDVQVATLFNDAADEPLVRLKLTHIVQSNEWILGISWWHALGDAASCLHFSNTLSRLYQNMEPTKPLPIFERRLWREDEADPSLLSTMKHLRDAKPLGEVIKIFLDDQQNYDPVNLHFSGDQLATIRGLAVGNNITIQDALTAYVVLTLNTYCYNNDDDRCLLRMNTAMNFRGISDSIAPQGQVANAVYTMLSENFEDPYSLSSIANAIRQSIIKARDPKVLEPRLATVDGLMRTMARDNTLANLRLSPNEIFFNSNLRYDWASLVDFGYTDQCRFYTAWSGASFVRVFRLNPEKDGNTWLPRDRDGAEISFRMEKDLKDVFINACKKDMNENFQNIKK